MAVDCDDRAALEAPKTSSPAASSGRAKRGATSGCRPPAARAARVANPRRTRAFCNARDSPWPWTAIPSGR